MEQGVSQENSDQVTQASQRSSKKRATDECVICLEPVSERAIAVPCNHYCFDFICLVSWLQETSKCPLCKAELTAVEYDWQAPDDHKTFRVASTSRPNRDQDPLSSTNPRRRFYTSTVRRGRGRLRRVPQPQQTTPDLALSRRRYVYRNQLYSLHVGSNRLSRFKDFTPQMVSRDAELQSRARKWIRRELQVFEFLAPNSSSIHASSEQELHTRRANNTEFLLEYIVSILKTVDIKSSSGKAQEKLGDFLGHENANLFLHELEAWLRSPFMSLEDWDRATQYRERLPGFEGSDSSSGSYGKHVHENTRNQERSDVKNPHYSRRLNPS